MKKRVSKKLTVKTLISLILAAGLILIGDQYILPYLLPALSSSSSFLSSSLSSSSLISSSSSSSSHISSSSSSSSSTSTSSSSSTYTPLMDTNFGMDCVNAEPTLDLTTYPASYYVGNQTTVSGNLVLHFINVGQADAIFIELPNDQTMLIDAGASDASNVLINYLLTNNFTEIDYFIATHPHADHIGEMDQLLANSNFTFHHIFMPNKVNDTLMFCRIITNTIALNKTIHLAKADVPLIDLDSLDVEMLSPIGTDYGTNLNEYSAVVKINYLGDSFLFMGDAEVQNEQEMITHYGASALDVDLVKIGHHGSRTSSSLEFVNATSPDIGVMFYKIPNSYDLPDEDVLTRWETASSSPILYNTFDHGTIICTSTGSDIGCTTERSPGV